ncbi:MAG: TatD family hydrolase [Erysipelotrichaceae bacterium]|nr:TatD family hydrolase [Erysipelotrichaceae bacterium]
MKIFDTHCHFNHDDFYLNTDQYLKEAKENNVSRFLVVGYDKESSLRAVKLAEQHEEMYAAVGFHPTEIDIAEEDFQIVMNLLNHPKVVAIGEIGLDYHWVKDLSQREKQKKYFIRQIEIANRFNKPIVVHNRDAMQDCFDILKEHRVNKGGIMHCYSGSVEMAIELIKLDFMIGLGGPVTFLNAKTPKEVAKIIPLQSLVLETDAPYLAPHPYRGQTNRPMYITLVLEEISKIRNMTSTELAKITYENACRMFHV